MDYRTASTTELIEALRDQERHPDLELVQVLLKRGAGIIPDLVEMVETEMGWPQIHAALLLCELRAESALPILQQAISAPEGRDLSDWLVDDALEKFGPAALGVLETVAADKTVEWHQRAMACRVMMVIAYHHPESYERVTAFLRGLLPDPNSDWAQSGLGAYASHKASKEAVDEPRIWTSVVARLCDLRDPQAYDLIGQLFQAGLVDETVIDAALYRQAYQKSGPPESVSEEPMDLLTRYNRNRPQAGRLSLRERWARLRKR